MRIGSSGRIFETYLAWLVLGVASIACGDPNAGDESDALTETSAALEDGQAAGPSCSFADVQWPSGSSCTSDWRYDETQCTRPASCSASAAECEPGAVRVDTIRTPQSAVSTFNIIVNLSSCHLELPADTGCEVQKPGKPRPMRPCKTVCSVTNADVDASNARCTQLGTNDFQTNFAAQLNNGEVEYLGTTPSVNFGLRLDGPMQRTFKCTATSNYNAISHNPVCTLCQFAAPCTTSNKLGYAGYTAGRMKELAAPAGSGRSIASEACTTCDDSPLAADGSNAAQKFACLDGMISPSTRTLNEQRMQLIYELFGSELSDAQRTRAQATYVSPAPQFAKCSSSSGFLCTNDDAQRARLNECDRLAAPHSDIALTIARFDACLDAVKQVAGGGACGTREDDVERARKLARRLVDKVNGYVEPADDSSASGPINAATRRAYFVGQWWRAASQLAPYQTDGAARAEGDLEAVLAAYWSFAAHSISLDALRVAAADSNTSEAQLKTMLNDVIAGGMKNRVVLDALLAPSSAVRLPAPASVRSVSTLLDGEAFLQLFVDAVQWNVDRAEALTSAHDLACLFADCAKSQPNTELVQFWWLISKLPTAKVSGETFTQFRADSLLSQLASVRSGVMQTTLTQANGSANDFSNGKNRLAALVERGTTHITNYRSHGLLRGDLARTLADAVDEAGARRIGDYVKEDAERFAAANGAYRDDLKNFLRDITSDVSSGVALDVALARRDYYLAKHDQLNAQIEALQASAARADLTFKDLDAELARISLVLNKTFSSPKGPAEQLTVTRNRPFVHTGKVGVNLTQLKDMAVWTGRLPMGHMTKVSIGDQEYSPTCLLRNLKVLDDHKGVGASVGSVFRDVPPSKALAPSGTETCGPEGFTLMRQGSESTVTSVDYQAGVSARAWAGIKYDGCVGGDFLFGSASTCAYGGVEVSTQASANSTYSHGVNSQTTVALKDGLRSTYAPFPSAPLGALLLVTEADGKIIDIDVASRGGLSAIAPVDANVYLVINDTYCDADTATPGLTVTVQEVETPESAAETAIKAIAAVRAKLRQQTSFYVNQRLMLPSERAAEQARANWELDAELAANKQTPESMPAALRELFEAVVTQEMSRIDRVLEIARLERERALSLAELVSLGHEVRGATAASRLNRILPFWALQDLRTDQLEARLDVLLHTVREQFIPVLQLWYPSFLDALSLEVKNRTNPNNAVMRLLDGLSPERSLADLSLSVQQAISDEVIVRFGKADRTRTTADRYEYIAVSIPNPEHPDHKDHDGVNWGSTLSYPTLDKVTSTEVWDQIKQGGIGQFSITPELVYSRIGARPGVVDCSVSTPIVRKMLVSMVRPGATDIETNNALRFKSRVTAGRENWVAQESGLARFELAEGAWTDMGLLVTDSGVASDGRVTVPNDVLYRLLASTTHEDTAGRDIGISPFGTFSVDFFGWNTRRDWLSHYDPREGVTKQQASELVVVMAIDSKPTSDGKALSWLTTCPGAKRPQ